jgi:hypothetical protein
MRTIWTHDGDTARVIGIWQQGKKPWYSTAYRQTANKAVMHVAEGLDAEAELLKANITEPFQDMWLIPDSVRLP